MKILLFGKNGQVGWELNRLLPQLGEVVALGREQADLADADSLRQSIREYKPDVIVNAAAYTAVDKAEDEARQAMTINAEAPGVMAEEARGMGSLMIHYSTDYVFNGKSEQPYTEVDKPDPINVYGESKLAGEKAVQASGCHHLIFRTSWVYSSRGSNFYLTILRLASKMKEINIVSDQTGAPTWARLIAETTIEVLRSAIDEIAEGGFTSDLYHLTSRGKTSWYGFARQIIDNIKTGNGKSLSSVPVINPISSEEYPTAARRPANSSLDVSKIEKQYGLELPEWDKSLLSFMQAVV